LAISIETKDEITNESSGRGLLLRRDLNEGEELLKVPLSLCITKKSALLAFPELPPDTNDYLAMACQLIHETFVLRERSFWKPYLDILPAVEEVNPTFTWSDEDLEFLQGSPVIAATKSLQRKLQREYKALLWASEDQGLCQKYPSRFPKEVREKPNVSCLYLLKVICVQVLTSFSTNAIIMWIKPFSLSF
jgi:histone-lysine N-methyltransferase SETD3